ncbi:hypothetical protein ACUJ46_10870 [Sandaracinobacteroides sp. A072]|uniref:hypothetical protein n=1 Tax=Sandaracinobacteroides sp. A072 TaxID=3461146 RepID=UPI004041DDFD
MVKWAALAGMVLLAACGYRAPVTRLETPDPALSKEALKDARADERKRVAKGLELPAQAQPLRVDELTVKLDVRPDDPFSLPPEGTRGRTLAPFPGDPAADTPARPAFPAPATTPED